MRNIDKWISQLRRADIIYPSCVYVFIICRYMCLHWSLWWVKVNCWNRSTGCWTWHRWESNTWYMVFNYYSNYYSIYYSNYYSTQLNTLFWMSHDCNTDTDNNIDKYSSDNDKHKQCCFVLLKSLLWFSQGDTQQCTAALFTFRTRCMNSAEWGRVYNSWLCEHCRPLFKTFWSFWLFTTSM